jgi:hypothetical protein
LILIKGRVHHHDAEAGVKLPISKKKAASFSQLLIPGHYVYDNCHQ